MPGFSTLISIVIPILIDNIDTDQIIPARFLKVIDKRGLGNNLFYDWRYSPDGSPDPDFILNQAEFREAKILLTGDNFGCGSSREHAPWALADYGFRAIISPSFADIFYNNSLKNGLLPIPISRDDHNQLVHELNENPYTEVRIDLVAQDINLLGCGSISFPIDSFSKHCLLQGLDELGYLLSFLPNIEAFENTRLN